MMRAITAKFQWGSQERDVKVLNPGGWFGQPYLIKIECGYNSVFYIVEADSEDDAIEAIEEYADYEKMTKGGWYSLDDLRVYELDPTQIRYHGADLPAKGVRADRYCQYQDWLAAR